MSKPKQKRKAPGLPPGSLVFTGQQKVSLSNIDSTAYTAAKMITQALTDRRFPPTPQGWTTWINIKGVHDIPLIQSLGQQYNIHPLVMEDILDIGQRPKLDEYDSGIFISFFALRFDSLTMQLQREQVSFFLAPNLLVSFQEDAEDVFAPIYERLAAEHSRMRSKGADYLLYSLMDTVVDYYFQVLDQMEDVMDSLESEILHFHKEATRSRIYQLRNEILQLRKLVVPLRDVLNKITRLDKNWIQPDSHIYFRDLYDHVVNVIDIVENYRDMINGLNDMYSSEISFKTNRVIQVLTIISTIFMPLTFIVGVYGMNFEFMPELNWRLGYPAVWIIMVAICGLMLLFFRRKKWL